MTTAALANDPQVMNGDPVLSVRDLSVHFPLRNGLLSHVAKLRAVDGVSFDLKPGETLGIVGESGCGKSTLGRAILRLIEPTGGRVAWMGQDFLGLDAKKLREQRRHMQIIFQDPLASLDPRMTVGKIIGKPLKTFNPGIGKAELRQRVTEVMQQVGLSPEMVGRYPHEFSGGQCQRIGIARAMILKPKLIVCDEPVSALDVSIQAQVINLLMRLQREHGLSLLFISHNLSVVRHISHRVLVLYLGKVMEIADRESFYRQPLHPYSQALISAIPVPDPKLERQRQRIVLQGDLPSPVNPPAGCRFCTRCPKATEICVTTPPELVDHGIGHLVACHHV
jgi:oligopeptide transport system ATP-binding protein